uniref:Uncharacterized protein n=1 Tax=Chromera velia CCMP2878 TaxID=1169474 RepID=A0A0G4GU73_9ALVE|eukprot:Cvel_765.t1-p1 / transcript=Cvel_765.t1 / gene=Cvel_765 / organism=Chromera_velia_CCMP2878 / gene_product=hypothetical protein / transcript_product=hypothetical protein / location=Cvel_scaffold23:174901-185196(+) / protein_length=2267 / sequence_SO=supercontig / SO=protein_coding / is_pseudo=false
MQKSIKSANEKGEKKEAKGGVWRDVWNRVPERIRRRWPLWATLCGLFWVTVVLIILTFTVIIPAIVRSQMENTEIVQERVIIRDVQESSFTIDMQGRIESESDIEASLEPTQMEVYCATEGIDSSFPLGRFVLPEVTVKGPTPLTFKSPFVVSRPDEFGQFVEALMARGGAETATASGAEVEGASEAEAAAAWKLDGSTTVTVLGMSFSGIEIQKELQFEAMGGFEDVTVTSFDLSGSDTEAVRVAAEVEFVSPGKVGVEDLGELSLGLFAPSAGGGYVQIGELKTAGSLMPGKNHLKLQGKIPPPAAGDSAASDALQKMMQSFLKGDALEVLVRGLGSSQPLFDRGVKRLEMVSSLSSGSGGGEGGGHSGVSSEELVKGFEFLGVNMDTVAGKENSHVKLSGGVRVTIASPLGPNSPIEIEEVNLEGDLVYKGSSNLGKMSNAKLTPSESKGRRLTGPGGETLLEFPLHLEAELELTGGGGPFKSFVNDFRELDELVVGLGGGRANVKAKTVVGPLLLDDVPLSQSSAMKGMGGLKGVAVKSFGIGGSNPDGSWDLTASVLLPNPSAADVDLGQRLAVGIDYMGQTLAVLESVDKITIKPGDNFVEFKGKLLPVPEGNQAAMAAVEGFFQAFLSKSPVGVQVKALTPDQAEERGMEGAIARSTGGPPPAPWLSGVLEGFEMSTSLGGDEMPLGGATDQPLLRSSEFQDLKMDFEGATEDGGLPLSGKLKLVLNNPLGPTEDALIDVQKLSFGTQLRDRGGRVVGTLELPLTDNELSSPDAINRPLMMQNENPNMLHQQNEEDKDVHCLGLGCRKPDPVRRGGGGDGGLMFSNDATMMRMNGHRVLQAVQCSSAEGTLCVEVALNTFLRVAPDRGAFNRFVAEYFASSSVPLWLEGKASVGLGTSLSSKTLELQDIPVTSQMEIPGLNGLAGSEVSTLEFSGPGSLQGRSVALNLLLTIINPSATPLNLGAPKVNLVFEGVKVGTVSSDSFNALPNQASQVRMEGELQAPDDRTRAKLSQMFQAMVDGTLGNRLKTEIDMGASAGGVGMRRTPAWLSDAMRQIDFSPQMPSFSEMFGDLVRGVSLSGLSLAPHPANGQKLRMGSELWVSALNPFKTESGVALETIGFSADLFDAGIGSATAPTADEGCAAASSGALLGVLDFAPSAVSASGFQMSPPTHAGGEAEALLTANVSFPANSGLLDLSDDGTGFGEFVGRVATASADGAPHCLRINGTASVRVVTPVGDVTLRDMAIDRSIGMKGLGLTSDSTESDSGNFDFGDLHFTGPAEEGRVLTGARSFQPRGVGFEGRLTVANPSTTGVELGDTVFDLFVPRGGAEGGGAMSGEAELVKFGTVTIQSLSMTPGGSTSLTVTGQLGPLPSGPEGDVSAFLAGYLRKEPSMVVARGAASSSSPVWKQKLVDRLELSMTLPHVPSVSTDGLVRNVKSGELNLRAEGQTFLWLGTSMSGELGSPFGDDTAMQLLHVSLTVRMEREENGRNVTLAEFNTGRLDSRSSLVNLISLTLTDVLLLLDGDGSAFGRMAASLLESESGTSVFLKGTMEAGVITDLGEIASLPDLAVDLALDLPSFSFSDVDSPSLSNLRIQDSAERRDALSISAGASFNNPASGALSLGPAEFDLFASGQKIAVLRTDDLNLTPGMVSLMFEGQVAPQTPGERQAISSFVNAYLGNGPAASLTLTGSPLHLFSSGFRRLFEENGGEEGEEGGHRRLQTSEPARWVSIALSAFRLTLEISVESLGGGASTSDLVQGLELQGLAFNFDRQTPSLSGAVTVQYSLPEGIEIRHAVRNVECDLVLSHKGKGPIGDLGISIPGAINSPLLLSEVFRGQFRDASLLTDPAAQQRMADFVGDVIFKAGDNVVLMEGTGRIEIETAIGPLELDGISIQSEKKIASMAGRTFTSETMRATDLTVTGGTSDSLILDASLEIDYSGELTVFIGDLDLDLFMPFSPFNTFERVVNSGGVPVRSIQIEPVGAREIEGVGRQIRLINGDSGSDLVMRNEFDLRSVNLPATALQLSPGPKYPPSLEPSWDVGGLSYMIKIGTVTIKDLRLIAGRTAQSKLAIEVIPVVQTPQSAERTGPQQLVSRYISQMWNVVMLKGRPESSASPFLSSLSAFKAHLSFAGSSGAILSDTSMSVNLFPPRLIVFPTIRNPFETSINILSMALDIYDGETFLGWTRNEWTPPVALPAGRSTKLPGGLNLEIVLTPSLFFTFFNSLNTRALSVKIMGKIDVLLDGYRVLIDYKDDDVSVELG